MTVCFLLSVTEWETGKQIAGNCLLGFLRWVFQRWLNLLFNDHSYLRGLPLPVYS